MSGHSHWSTIKRKKAVEDAKRGKVFTKVGRMLAVAARKSKLSSAARRGAELYAHPPAELKLAIERAKFVNMPKDSIIKAIERGLGLDKGVGELAEGLLEGYGPGGVAFLLRFLTDNRNRTLAEIRSIFTRFGGRLAEAGSTAYIFGASPEKPSFFVPIADERTGEKVLELAQALQSHNDIQDVYANFEISTE